tara:strand:+ start:918 stop:2135 length:1218 start_codon:yes stop_codon:yes gene_type:complete
MADSKVQPELIELSDDFPFTGDVSGTVADGSITDVKVSDMAASKLTGALPAVSGAALTNLPQAYTKNASDPLITTNSTVGALWVNQVSGETYVCTDATTDENVWTNIGGGTGDVQPYVFGGTISGYTSGGYRDPASVGNFDGIWKFSFATGAQNAAQIGIITVARHQAVASSSKNHGYSAGGGTIPSPNINVIDKFTFASDNDATDVGDTVGIINYAGGNSSANHGYICGNDTPTDIIQKYTFAADAGSVDVANLSSSRQGNAGQNASAYGYSVHGSASTNIIDKFPFASDSDATDIGNLTYARWSSSGQSSETHGYTSGGDGGPGGNEIDKFTFASDNDATTVGVLTVGRNNIAGQSSRTFGYSCGGSGPWSNVIDKFAFASDGDATDVGDLPAEKGYFQGHNY